MGEPIRQRLRRDDDGVGLAGQEGDDVAYFRRWKGLPRSPAVEVEEVVVERVDEGDAPEPQPPHQPLDRRKLLIVVPVEAALEDEEVRVSRGEVGSMLQPERARDGRVRQRTEQPDVGTSGRYTGLALGVQAVEANHRRTAAGGCARPRTRVCGAP